MREEDLTDRRGAWISRRGAGAAGALIVACGAMGASSVAGAEGPQQAGAASQLADATIGVDETNGQKFVPADVTIDTGDTVTWNFDGSKTPHNAASENEVPADPAWAPFKAPPGANQYVTAGQFPRRFTQPGTYEYFCEVHPVMKGTITVTGAPVETAEPTATATPTPTPTATPSPVVPQATPTPPASNPPSGQPPAADDHTSTPPPTRVGGPRADRTAPTVSSLRLRGVTRGARVSFRLSEAASVTLSISKRGSRRVLRTVRLQARAGTRIVTVRSSRLARGSYVVSIQARDAMGNRSPLSRASVRVSR